jgi:hypothetical protein
MSSCYTVVISEKAAHHITPSATVFPLLCDHNRCFVQRNMNSCYTVVISEKVAHHITPSATVFPLLCDHNRCFVQRNMNSCYTVVISEKAAHHITPSATVSPLLCDHNRCFAQRNMNSCYIVVISEKAAHHITPLATVFPLLWICLLLVCGPLAGNILFFFSVLNKWLKTVGTSLDNVMTESSLRPGHFLTAPFTRFCENYVTVVTTACLAFHLIVKNCSINANRISLLADWLTEFLRYVRWVVLSHWGYQCTSKTQSDLSGLYFLCNGKICKWSGP